MSEFLSPPENQLHATEQERQQDRQIKKNAMAFPRVFISSTCYDLADLRDGLDEFVRGYGFDTVLSENGDVFYHPDLHTHECCTKEVSNCHLFILIIGGRFGGTYRTDTSKSIVNAEYAAARELNLPTFTFVKNEVNEDHRVFVKNRDNAANIIFPSIERQEHAIKIFTFLDDVRRADSNNGYFSFSYTSEIKELLRKQWAGMFYDFLSSRVQNKLLQQTQTELVSISSINEKIEGLAKSILRAMEGSKADGVIDSIENENEARSFLRFIRRQFQLEQLYVPTLEVLESIDRFSHWYEFIGCFSGFKYNDRVSMLWQNGETTVAGELTLVGLMSWPVSGQIEPSTRKRVDELQRNFETLKSLKPDRRMDILREFVEVGGRERE